MDLSRFRVLVAKDSPALRDFAQPLEAAGHLVETATSLPELLARLRHMQFDIVVMDVELRGETTASGPSDIENSRATIRGHRQGHDRDSRQDRLAIRSHAAIHAVFLGGGRLVFGQDATVALRTSGLLPNLRRAWLTPIPR